MTPEPLQCAEVLALLPHYLDGELTPELRARVEAHAATCPSCANFAQAYSDLIAQLQGGLPPAPPASDTFLDRLRDSIPLK